MQDTAEPKLLDIQLALLKQEIEVINTAITQGDEITKNVKQWAITVWAAALGGALTTADLRPFAWATFVLPLVFWLVDASHRVDQRRFIWRNLKIMDFLNDGALERSVVSGRLVDFTLLDITSRRDRSDGLRTFISWRRVMLFRTLSVLYIGLALISWLAWATAQYWK